MERRRSIDYGSSGSGVTISPGSATQAARHVSPRVRYPSRCTVSGANDLSTRGSELASDRNQQTEPVAEVRGLRVAFGTHQVLRGVDLALNAGDFVGILGPNGSGKTTLLRALRGLLRPVAGETRLFGREARRWPRRELAQRVGVVPQRDELQLPFTVEEVVLMGRAPHLGPLPFESARDRRIAARAMEALDLVELRGRSFPELSGGERQRTLVARALAQEPTLLLLDEPTAALDIRHQVEVLDLLDRKRRAGGLTIVAALHDLNLASLYCTRILLLREGHVHADGPTDEVLTYANVKAVYDAEVYVGVNELNGKVFLVPMAPRQGQQTT